MTEYCPKQKIKKYKLELDGKSLEGLVEYCVLDKPDEFISNYGSRQLETYMPFPLPKIPLPKMPGTKKDPLIKKAYHIPEPESFLPLLFKRVLCTYWNGTNCTYNEGIKADENLNPPVLPTRNKRKDLTDSLRVDKIKRKPFKF